MNVTQAVASMQANGYDNKEISKRLLSAVADYDRFINKEEMRDASLRPADVQQILDGYKTKRNELIAAIALL